MTLLECLRPSVFANDQYWNAGALVGDGFLDLGPEGAVLTFLATARSDNKIIQFLCHSLEHNSTPFRDFFYAARPRAEHEITSQAERFSVDIQLCVFVKRELIHWLMF